MRSWPRPSSILVIGLFVAMMPGPVRGRPMPQGIGSSDPQVAALNAQLLHASDASASAEIASRLESLRTGRLSPTVRLLVRRAQREAGDNKVRDALGDMNDAVDLQPDQALLWRERSAVRAVQGDEDGAVNDLGGALSRDPTDIQSWSALSTVEERRSRPEQAFEAWEHVLQLDPAIAGGADRLARLHRQMRGDPT